MKRLAEVDSGGLFRRVRDREHDGRVGQGTAPYGSINGKKVETLKKWPDQGIRSRRDGAEFYWKRLYE